MQKDDAVRLRHMLDAAREAMDFAKGRQRTDLANDRQLVLALVKEVEIIGEAAYQCTERTRSDLREISWEDIIGKKRDRGFVYARYLATPEQG